jgi:hypothetical protein
MIGTIYYTAVTPGKHTYCFFSKNPVKTTFQILGGHPADSGVPAHLRCTNIHHLKAISINMVAD